MAIIDQSRRSDFTSQLLAVMQMQQQKQREREQLAQQERQFQQSYGLQERSTDASVRAADASVAVSGENVRRSQYETAADRAKRIIESLTPNVEALRANGRADAIPGYIQTALSKNPEFAADPEVQAAIVGLVAPREQMPSDVTAQNVGQWKADVTGRVLQGDEDVQDRNLAYKIGTGEQMSGPSFADQAQRQPEAGEPETPYGQALGIAREEIPTGNAQLQAKTQIQIGREGNASAERVARIRETPPTGTGTGMPGEQLYAGLSTPTATAVRSRVAAFKTEPLVQNFATIQEGRNFAASIPTSTKNPADDQALIYSLAKALDPGSVVREGEYATVQKYSQAWIAAFGKGVEQAILGTGFLSQEARNNIKATIERKYAASKTSYDNLQRQYAAGIGQITGRNDGERFLVDYATQAGSSAPAGSGVIETPDGLKWKRNPDGSMTQVP